LSTGPAPAPGPDLPPPLRRGWRGPGRFAHWPIRRKLLAMVLLPLLVVLPLLGLLLLVWADMAIDRMLTAKVRSDLAVARGYFDRVLAEVASGTAAVADSHALHAALAGPAAGAAPRAVVVAPAASGAAAGAAGTGVGGSAGASVGELIAPPDLAALQAVLLRFKQREGLDFVNLRRPDGTLLLADAAVAAAGTANTLPAAELAPALADRVVAELAVLAPAEQSLLGPLLAARVAVPLLATQQAQASARTTEDRALVLRALAPVRAADGRVLALVQAGVLLNRNLPFIDHINQIVYPDGALPFGSRGTATLFLDDVRISTNVRLFDGPAQARAVGTRVSQVVRQAVLQRGDTWLGRAFVVNDWYVSAYQPLADRDGRRVGMLYVGFTEQPFTWLKYGALAGIGLIFFGVMVLAAVWSARWARQIFKPLEQMAATMQQVEQGVLGARVGPVAAGAAAGGGDEVSALAGHLDHLLDTIADKTQALERWNAELDAKVAERSAALAAAQAQLLRAEKMAAVGQLTASIAHEVNNPIAVIQGNLDLARELLGANAQTVQAELALVDQQIERMRLIVTQLLQFARPTDYAGYVDAVDVAQALDDSLVLTRHLLASSAITVQRGPHTGRRAGINRQELQQVLVNLIVNAVQAMPEGGTLTLASADWADAAGRPGVAIRVADTGAGLDERLLGEMFQPFVTRKKDGTGLGLWISRSIVERYGGDLVAHNRRPAGSAAAGPAGAELSVLLLSEPATVGTAGATAGSAAG